MGIKNEIIPKIIEALKHVYGVPKKPDKNLPILDVIILSILEPDETPGDVRSAYRVLKTEFVDWNELRVTHPKEIQGILETKLKKHLHEKSHKIKDILAQIFTLFNSLDLQFLWETDFSEIQKFLQQIHGLKENIIYRLITYACYQEDYCLSSSFLRVGKRIPIWNDNLSQNMLKKLLFKEIGSDDLFYLHVLLFHHGESHCVPKGCNCPSCCILKYCERGMKESESRRKTQSHQKMDTEERKRKTTISRRKGKRPKKARQMEKKTTAYQGKKKGKNRGGKDRS